MDQAKASVLQVKTIKTIEDNCNDVNTTWHNKSKRMVHSDFRKRVVAIIAC